MNPIKSHAGWLALLATLALRLRGIDVTTFARNAKPNLNAELIEQLGARYLITQEVPIIEGAKKHGPFDLIFEATGNSGVVFDSRTTSSQVKSPSRFSSSQ